MCRGAVPAWRSASNEPSEAPPAGTGDPCRESAPPSTPAGSYLRLWRAQSGRSFGHCRLQPEAAYADAFGPAVELPLGARLHHGGGPVLAPGAEEQDRA